MQLVLSLYFIAAKGNFTVSVSHIHGVNNTLADALSRGHVEKFKAKAPAGRSETNTATDQLGITLDHDVSQFQRAAVAPIKKHTHWSII